MQNARLKDNVQTAWLIAKGQYTIRREAKVQKHAQLKARVQQARLMFRVQNTRLEASLGQA